MKCTSYLISKQLHEAGFRSKDVFDYCYKKGEEDGVWNRAFEVACWENEDLDNYYPAFEFGEILEEFFKLDNILFKMSKYSISIKSNKTVFRVGNTNNEFAVDKIARLLLRFHERGLVKFEESPQEKALKKTIESIEENIDVFKRLKDK